VLVLYAALNDYFSKFEPSQMQEIEKKYLEYVQNLHADLLEKIKTEKAISDETEAEIKKIISSFIESQKM
ncbi:MAG: F0F1 ATP synthase subunit alpha, partial [Ignavibacteria bacterium CG08_land_8_20_14_0_20_37_9]